MSLGLAYWILMLIWFVFGLWWAWPLSAPAYHIVGSNVLLFILLVLVGWRVFGPPLHG